VVGCLTGPASQIVGCVSAVEEKNKDATPTPAA
jgi:hypothetical protein